MWGEWTDVVRISHYLDDAIRNGFSPIESAEWTGVQMLGLGCLTPHGFEPRQLKNAPPGIRSSHAALLRDGDVLMSRANTRELVGLVGRYRDVGSPCIYPDLMMRLRPSASCLPDFLEHLLRSPIVRRRIMASAQGTSESMVKISASTVSQLQVPLVPLGDQWRIVEALDAVDSRVAAEEQALTGRLHRVCPIQELCPRPGLTSLLLYAAYGLPHVAEAATPIDHFHTWKSVWFEDATEPPDHRRNQALHVTHDHALP